MRKKVIVLGGSSGIGKAVAKRFAKEGYSVLVAALDYSACASTVAELPGSGHLAISVDVRLDAQITSLCQKVPELFGTFDIYVNSIGLSRSVDALDSEFDKWDELLQAMMYGAVK